MAKKTQTNIVEVWNWLIPVLETEELSATEQIVLVHVIAALNRNLWRPTKINERIIAAIIRKDARTIKSAMKTLKDKNLLIEKQGGVFIATGDDRYEQYSSRNNEQSVQPRLNTRAQGDNGESTETAEYSSERRIFQRVGL